MGALPHKKTLGFVLLVALGLGASGCRRSAPKKEKTPAPQTTNVVPLALPSVSAEAAPEASSSSKTLADQDGAPEKTHTNGKQKRKPRGPGSARFLMDGPEAPIAIGGAATVYSKGVIFRLPGNAAAVTLFGPDGPAPGPNDPERAKKWPRGRVSVAEDPSGIMHTYWVEGTALVRSELSADGKLGPPEIVTNDAVAGSSPSAVRTNNHDAVAYLAMPNKRNAERNGRMWIEGSGVLDLSPEGSGATSISLVQVGDGQVIAMWLDARSAMTPVHARRFEVREKTTAIASDDVVFVGGPPDGYTELVAIRSGLSAAGLLPLATEKGFALHNILVDWNGKTKIDALDYPNGIDSAPVAGANACGETILAYARPESKEPGSPHVLEIATVGPNGTIEPQEVAAYPGQVLELSMAASDPNTAWIVYTAGTKSFALRIGCGGKAAPAKGK